MLMDQSITLTLTQRMRVAVSHFQVAVHVKGPLKSRQQYVVHTQFKVTKLPRNMRVAKLTKQEFALVAVHKQLEIAGVDKSVLQSDKEWFSNNTITEEQHTQWKHWFLEEYRLNFKRSKREAEKEFAWFDLGYGLKVNG